MGASGGFNAAGTEGAEGPAGAGLGLETIGGGNRTGALAKGLSGFGLVGAGFGGGAAAGSGTGTGWKGDPVAGGGGLVAGVWPKAG